MKKMIRSVFLLLMLLAVPAAHAFAQIDVPGTLFDGTQFTARIHIAPDEEPVYIVLDQLTIGGMPFDVISDNFSDMWSGYPQGSERKSLTYEFFVQLEEGYVSPSTQDSATYAPLSQALTQSGKIEASFRITLLAPRQSIVEVDCSFNGDSAAVWQQIDEIVARGDTPVQSDEPYTARVSSRAFSNVRYDEPVSFPLGDVQALTEHANMRIVEQEVFSFIYTK